MNFLPLMLISFRRISPPVVLTVGMLFLTFLIQAQTDGCGSPTTLPINASCTSTAFSVPWNGTTQTTNASCATGTAYEDGWFLVTATSASTTITVTNPDRDVCLAAFTGCGTGQQACTMISSGGTGSITFPTTAGTSYYIQVQRRSGNNNADLDGSICAVANPTNGPGGTCATATALTLGTSQCGTNSNPGIFPDGGTAPTNSCNTNYNDGEYWFSYTATNTQSLNLALSGLNATFSGMFVYAGCPGAGGTCFSSITAGASTANYSLTTPALVAGQTYYIGIVNWSTPYSTSFCLNATLVTPTPTNNTTCVQPTPVCSGSAITFTANSGGPTAHSLNPGNNYNCLSTTPNPSWYYLEIDQSGTLAIDITAGSDIDFALWGPFANLSAAQSSCNAYGTSVDCSYSTSAIEQANATVTAGQVYILLVTNYANTVQNITINEAGSNTASTNCGIVPLPVGYSQWDLHYIDEQVVLNWGTETERDNEKFLVQRSNDGVIWETIGAVAGNGTTTEAHYYNYTDQKPLKGVGYYRLMQLDINGTASFTSVLSVNTNKVDRLAVYPNPAQHKFSVMSGSKAIDQLVITDVIGQSFEVVYTQTESGWDVDCSGLAPGIYTLSLVSDGHTQSERLVIKR
jgi:hypothetical protein